ncbi:AMP-binding protein [Flavobacterium cellulosilyticum]|uniref:O-succinylbenzoic acid--CoA ligase n=1 Tax=Flavobacterium cellulosilyticum TaxID=2541731 RepID=A0A4R5CAT3_9FLAO|nr:AMP-binding protein [Flavobacterium cellulosilyticum]TDD97051.1 O-succinylbenzoic acid--CoA ligase [Flavobacterium cellulosilyticum]
MNKITYKNIHNRFKLNGYHINLEQMYYVAYSFIKEGEPFEQHVGNFLLDWFDDKSFIELQTSGSTGNPKVFKIEKQAMLDSALATGDFFGLKPGDTMLHCLPTNYVAGKMMFVRSFILGLDMEFVKPTSNPLKNNEKVYDFSAMVPLQAKNSLDQLKAGKIKKLIIGGVKVHKALEDELVKLPMEIFETYGMTETITHIAAKKIGEKNFTVLPNVTVSVNEEQCLVINAKNISNDLIVTNDLVNLVSDTQFSWKGRIDNVINSGGVKILPEAIEEKLSTLIPRRYFIYGQKDEILGKKIVLFVEGEPLDIQDSVFNVLDKFEKPKEIKFLPKFKETMTGKILRRLSIAQLTNN